MFNLFKKRTFQTKKVDMQLINVKRNKNIFNCFKGKFVSIEVDEKIDLKYYNLCNNYDYGLIYSYDNDSYTIAIICKKGYLKAFDISLNQELENGTSFIINNNDLIDNNKIVGTIKRATKETISLNCLDHNKLICFIEK
ncbi:MAG: hypothetical protein KHW57_08000 [Clostridium sp.]|nr:hypothetical protein [Clostridium sp.]